jgi:hypothetical protein
MLYCFIFIYYFEGMFRHFWRSSCKDGPSTAGLRVRMREESRGAPVNSRVRKAFQNYKFPATSLLSRSFAPALVYLAYGTRATGYSYSWASCIPPLSHQEILSNWSLSSTPCFSCVFSFSMTFVINLHLKSSSATTRAARPSTKNRNRIQIWLCVRTRSQVARQRCLARLLLRFMHQLQCRMHLPLPCFTHPLPRFMHLLLRLVCLPPRRLMHHLLLRFMRLLLSLMQHLLLWFVHLLLGLLLRLMRFPLRFLRRATPLTYQIGNELK